MDAAVVNTLRGEAEAAEVRALAGVGDDFEFAHEQAAHRVHVGNVAEVGIFAAKIFDAGRAADAPFAGTLLFQNVSAGVGIAADFADDLLENVVNGDQAGGAAEFVEHDGEAAALALERLKKLEQIHARGNEGWKFDGFGEIDIWVEQERTRVENADDRVGRFIVNGQAAVFVFARGLDHFLDAEVVGNAGHGGARFHHVAGGLAFHADDLENDFLFGAGESALLPGDFEKVLIFLVGEDRLWFEVFGNGAQNESFEAVGKAAGGFAVFGQHFDGTREADGPKFRSAHAESFRKDFADEQDENEKAGHRENDRRVAFQKEPQDRRDHGAVGERVAENDGGEDFVRFFEKVFEARGGGRSLGELLDAPASE